MSNFRFRHIERFRTGGIGSNIELSLPLARSAKGWTHRYCPTPACVPRRFQLGDADDQRTIVADRAAIVRRNPGQAGTTRPYCGTDADDAAFIDPADKKLAIERVEWAVGEDVADSLEEIARSFNRSMGRGGLISMSMKVDRRRRSEPRGWREDLLRGLRCDVCARAYGVYAIGLYCPDCGAGNLPVHFDREVELVKKQAAISNDLSEAGEQELAYRILSNAHEDVVTALETYLKTVLGFLIARRCADAEREDIASEMKRGNPFQRIDRGRALYGRIGLNPYDVLFADESSFVAAHIEKRHVIGHNLGLADEKYIEKAGGTPEGQTVAVVSDEVVTSTITLNTICSLPYRTITCRGCIGSW